METMGGTYFDATHGWLLYVDAGYLASNFLMAMFVAWRSRHLPSVFNAKTEIFTAGVVNGIANLVFGDGIAAADMSRLSPNLMTVQLS